MKTIRITIQTEPTPKGRPRTKFINGHALTYTPHKTREAQDVIKERSLKHRLDAFPAHVPIRLSITFYRTKSKYLPKKETMPFRKPDLPNLLALACDAMSDVLYEDDAELTTIRCAKRWSSNGEGYITIKLEPDSLKGDENADNV